MVNKVAEYMMCGRKQSFETQSKANRHISKQWKPELWKTYECPHCFCWHIAHKQPTKRPVDNE